MNTYTHTSKLSDGTRISHNDFEQEHAYTYNFQLDDGEVYARIYLQQSGWSPYYFLVPTIGREKHRGPMGKRQQTRANALMIELKAYTLDYMETHGWYSDTRILDRDAWRKA